MHLEQDLSEVIPCYNIFNEKIGTITIREALKHVAEDEMYIRSKGRGVNRRYTSCKWKVFRTNVDYKPRDSGGYTVMQRIE
jgi:hypothetical protein